MAIRVNGNGSALPEQTRILALQDTPSRAGVLECYLGLLVRDAMALVERPSDERAREKLRRQAEKASALVEVVEAERMRKRVVWESRERVTRNGRES